MTPLPAKASGAGFNCYALVDMMEAMAKQGKRTIKKTVARPKARPSRHQAPKHSARPPIIDKKLKRTAIPLQASRRIEGSVHQVIAGKQTDALLSAAQAFSDSTQAKAQVIYFETHGTKEDVRLARIAYRQFQGKRFRQE
jgi:hypothetical protein